jgi:hypothetical protein
LWERASRGRIRSRKPKAFWDDNSGVVAAFLFPRGDVDANPIAAITTIPLTTPAAVDVQFLDRLVRVFNNDVSSAAEMEIDDELWLSLRQTQFRRAIAKFSAFSTAPMLHWLQILESSTRLRYEGEPFALSILMTKQIEWVAEPLGTAFVRMAHAMKFGDALMGEKWIRAATSSSRVGLVGLGRTGDIVGFFVIPQTLGENETEKWRVAPHVSLRAVQHLVRDGTGAFITSPAGDLRVIMPNGAIFLNSQGRWRYLNYEAIIPALTSHVSEDLAVALIRSAVDLSFERHGALFCVLDKADEAPNVVPDHSNKKANITLRESVRGLNLLEWNERQVIVSAATIDGAIVLDSAGEVIDAACMIGDPSSGRIGTLGFAELMRGAGARETAAWNASIYGLSIKVSEDGPISVYKYGKLVAVVG